ncbi:hypothetical protein HWV07_04360 [Natronomonas salina]|uniref:hypothetical protein n=1 Tax=Natronomonas salina TaxID=1710540 RepID=UPI0015B63137|nr:hypothetical protein [Natronomonas salina]QLD88307.1 hypothetical protein HWV07_04360 [Natronomonas salina]
MTQVSDVDAETVLESIDKEASDARRWVRRYLEDALANGFEGGLGDFEEERESDVCVLRTEVFEFFVPRADVPPWIDADRELPVECDPS